MKSSKPILLVDVDDTIEDLLGAWCAELNRKHSLSVKKESITNWEIADFFPTLTRKQVFAPLHTASFWNTVKPRPDAVKYLKLLYDEGYNIYLCTSTDYRNIRAKYEKIIKRYFPYISWDNVIITNNKQMIKADFLIDDGVHNLENGDYKKILISCPHNKSYDARGNGMYRANDWQDVYRIIHAEDR